VRYKLVLLKRCWLLVLICSIGVHACSSIKPTTSGKHVTVNGHRLYIKCDGEGLPVVILEAGLGANSASFTSVHSDVAHVTTVCSYDRVNLGRSESAPGARTSADSVNDLENLLRKINLPKSYVLVGVSMGGINVRLYATSHPHEVAGMVFVDSTHEDLVRRYGQVLTAEQLDETMNAAENNAEHIQVRKSLLQALIAPWRNDIPLIVLAHDPARGRPPREREQAWQEMQAELASRSKQGRLIVVQGSSHVMTRDNPQAIVDAIREVVSVVRAQLLK
jgi:pimeloyl-ACP methyl ester carboxylesterase